MNRLNYDYGYTTRKKNGYYSRQLFNSVKPSTYQENYQFPNHSWIPWKRLSVMSLLAAVTYLVLIEFEWIDPLKEFLFGLTTSA